MKHQASAPLPLRQVRVQDDFWGTYQAMVMDSMLPYQWDALSDNIPGAAPSCCLRNFRIAAGLETGDHGGFVFQDSDLAKWLEAVAYALTLRPDPALEQRADEAIRLILAAQAPDGYLNTYYSIKGLDKRFTNLMDHHELYCFGHMLEAAIAYAEATGKEDLLHGMMRFADCIAAHIGAEAGKLPGYPGHEIAEMALMRLYRYTGEEKYCRQAACFIHQRGQFPLYFAEEAARHGRPVGWADGPLGLRYYQAAQPVLEQDHAEGHAVRAVYLYSGLADVARATGDDQLWQKAKDLFRSIALRRMYITGAIGSSPYGEAFTFDYDLPNDTVYGETCAAIGLVFFVRRMLEGEADSLYGDVMERALYNGVLSGCDLDGKAFFYVNPLEVLPEACRLDDHRRHVMPRRQKWFGCACCPPNLARLLTSLGHYAYTANRDTLFVHLYVGGQVSASLGTAQLQLSVTSGLPWAGDVSFRVETGATGTIALRLPGWSRETKLTLNGKAITPEVRAGYAYLTRTWQAGDTLTLSLDMTPTVQHANPLVRQDAGCIALTRGPLVYCLEEADNGKHLHLLRMAADADMTVKPASHLLGGVTVLTAPGTRVLPWETDALYQPATPPRTESVPLTFIPYYAWANRGEGEMRVWVREG